jgi:hypothetical protein
MQHTRTFRRTALIALLIGSALLLSMPRPAAAGPECDNTNCAGNSHCTFFSYVKCSLNLDPGEGGIVCTTTSC